MPVAITPMYQPKFILAGALYFSNEALYGATDFAVLLLLRCGVIDDAVASWISLGMFLLFAIVISFVVLTVCYADSVSFVTTCRAPLPVVVQ